MDSSTALKCLNREETLEVLSMSGLEGMAHYQINQSRKALGLVEKPYLSLRSQELKEWILARLREKPENDLVEAIVKIARERKRRQATKPAKVACAQLETWAVSFLIPVTPAAKSVDLSRWNHGFLAKNVVRSANV